MQPQLHSNVKKNLSKIMDSPDFILVKTKLESNRSNCHNHTPQDIEQFFKDFVEFYLLLDRKITELSRASQLTSYGGKRFKVTIHFTANDLTQNFTNTLIFSDRGVINQNSIPNRNLRTLFDHFRLGNSPLPNVQMIPLVQEVIKRKSKCYGNIKYNTDTLCSFQYTPGSGGTTSSADTTPQIVAIYPTASSTSIGFTLTIEAPSNVFSLPSYSLIVNNILYSVTPSSNNTTLTLTSSNGYYSGSSVIITCASTFISYIPNSNPYIFLGYNITFTPLNLPDINIPFYIQPVTGGTGSLAVYIPAIITPNTSVSILFDQPLINGNTYNITFNDFSVGSTVSNGSSILKVASPSTGTASNDYGYMVIGEANNQFATSPLGIYLGSASESPNLTQLTLCWLPDQYSFGIIPNNPSNIFLGLLGQNLSSITAIGLYLSNGTLFKAYPSISNPSAPVISCSIQVVSSSYIQLIPSGQYFLQPMTGLGTSQSPYTLIDNCNSNYPYNIYNVN